MHWTESIWHIIIGVRKISATTYHLPLLVLLRPIHLWIGWSQLWPDEHCCNTQEWLPSESPTTLPPPPPTPPRSMPLRPHHAVYWLVAVQAQTLLGSFIAYFTGPPTHSRKATEAVCGTRGRTRVEKCHGSWICAQVLFQDKFTS